MKQDLTKATRVRIPVEEAIQEAQNWRDFIGPQVSASSQPKIPKAVYISRDDIMALAKEFQNNENLVGTRAYFTLKYPWSEDIKNEIKFVLVPVAAEEGYPAGKDMLYIPDAKEYGGGPAESDLYDFTKPCPDYCDTQSAMYGEAIV
ncbi:hypothetical protein MUY27_13490 [Mucilaginibacter sp. RS28]|uniref:Uncharacterized protein n=1 Tax=Mucilaginibacter straminoryzae TaxID=2932774 RepID=A0A9X1X5D4_9SPHI|nr:hypothetical protein [Mucilaginibacter straminoryzae]MCJ8210725.1 hypothetical protein [Mucilaginibacter straminoryzae]